MSINSHTSLIISRAPPLQERDEIGRAWQLGRGEHLEVDILSILFSRTKLDASNHVKLITNWIAETDRVEV